MIYCAVWAELKVRVWKNMQADRKVPSRNTEKRPLLVNEYKTLRGGKIVVF